LNAQFESYLVAFKIFSVIQWCTAQILFCSAVLHKVGSKQEEKNREHTVRGRWSLRQWC